MNRQLNYTEIEYVLYHLQNHCTISRELKERFRFVGEDNEAPITKASVVFLLSASQANPVEIEHKATTIPLLYPSKSTTEWYQLTDDGNLIFYQDFIKSAFHLLSCYQETQPHQRDQWDRYPYESSLQKRFKFSTIPAVNYYFDIIIEGIEKYCKFHQLTFAKKRLFESYGFFLSHDVDRLSFFHPRETAYRILQLVNLRPANYSKAVTAKLIFKGIVHLITLGKSNDPWNNISQLISDEQEKGIHSTYYFLDNHTPKTDSRYRYSDKKIKKIFGEIDKYRLETGLHGNSQSYLNIEVMIKQKQDLTQSAGKQIAGIRQHYLRLHYPDTFRIQQQVGLLYDTSLGFAEHEGYRNSYCYPSKPFDHNRQEMIDLWEFPLMLMEVSVQNYQNKDFKQIELSAMSMIDESIKFGGFFSLLWHNCRLNEYEYPGVNQFYQSLLDKIIQKGAISVNGSDLLNLINSKQKH